MPSSPIIQPKIHKKAELLLPRAFYNQDARLLAPMLLNKIMVHQDGRSGRIVEVEAYLGQGDQASHSWKGPTPRNEVMFGEPGHLYVYFIYGMHFAVNIVAGGVPGSAVLIRALEPLSGIEDMREVRGYPKKDTLLTSGPGRLSQALGMNRNHNGLDLTKKSSVFQVWDDHTPPGGAVLAPRIGITRDQDKLWRWYVPGNPHVSKLLCST